MVISVVVGQLYLVFNRKDVTARACCVFNSNSLSSERSIASVLVSHRNGTESGVVHIVVIFISKNAPECGSQSWLARDSWRNSALGGVERPGFWGSMRGKIQGRGSPNPGMLSREYEMIW